MSLFMFQVSVEGWGKRLADEIHVCFGQMQEVFSCLLEVHLPLNSHQQLWMSLTNVQDLSVQPAHRGLGLALKVQLSCNKLTRGPSGSLVGRGNAAHTIKVTTGIPAIPNVVFVRESFLCCWSYELASVCPWEILHRKTGVEQCCFQPCPYQRAWLGSFLCACLDLLVLICNTLCYF